MTKKDFDKISSRIPTRPGIYQFKDESGEILYVGKARNLYNRLSSYFSGGRSQTNKTRVMVRKATQIDYIIVDSEHDALLLESTLIKEHQPRYNVMLKDGKTYTYICVKKERFPRVFFTRKIIKDGSVYFGPYTSKYRAKIVLELIKNLFPLRTCSYHLSQENIDKGKFKVCLEYHIGNCLGPCENLESEKSYTEKISQVKNMLRGNFGEVVKHLRESLNHAVEELKFEEAQDLKEKLHAFQEYQSKSTVVSTTIRDADVFSYDEDDQFAWVNYLKVVDGAVINSYAAELKKNLTEDRSEILTYAVMNIRERFNSLAPEVIVPFDIALPEKEMKVIVPQRGDKKALLDMGDKNLRYFIRQREKVRVDKKERETSGERIVKTLQKDLRMKEAPVHMECFDNSNLQGSDPVASCVIFKNAKPSKKDYRKFNIKTVVGPDDFASMEEVVYRRYSRLIKEEESLPQLIVIDGGKGQLNSAMKSIRKLDLQDKITVIGIAKRLEEIFIAGDPIPVYLDKRSESLKVIQQIRNEAHRFAITFHRDKRSRRLQVSSLHKIPGVGPKTTDKLLKHFGSLKKMSESPMEEIQSIVGPAMASKIAVYLNDLGEK